MPPLDAHAMVISDVGVVPLRLPQHPQLQTYAQLRPADTCSYGRIGAVATVIRTARALKDSSDKSNGKVKGPVEVPVETIPEKEEEEVQVTSYCIRFSGDLKKCERYLRSSDIQVLQVGEYSSQQVVQEVTLVSAGWMSEYSKHKYDQMLSVYDGPKVCRKRFLCVRSFKKIFISLCVGTGSGFRTL